MIRGGVMSRFFFTLDCRSVGRACIAIGLPVLSTERSQLSEVCSLAAANLDPNMLGAVTKKLDDVLDAKTAPSRHSM